MASISDPGGNAVSREAQIAALVAAGMSEVYARFVVAVEAGDISGDVVELDKGGQEVSGVNPGEGLR